MIFVYTRTVKRNEKPLLSSARDATGYKYGDHQFERQAISVRVFFEGVFISGNINGRAYLVVS